MQETWVRFLGWEDPLEKEMAIHSGTATAAKSLQSCPTLSDPVDCSPPPGSSVHEIFQGRVLKWVAISFSNAWKWKVKVKSLSHVRLLATGHGTADWFQIANIWWIIEKAKEFQKNIYFCFIDHAKAFDCVDHNKLWKILKEMGIPDHLTCLLRNLHAGQEATVRTGHGTTDWFQIEKGVRQGCL